MSSYHDDLYGRAVFFDAFLLRMKKKRDLLLNRKIGSHLLLFCRNSLIAPYEFTMEKLLFVVRSLKEVINLESLLLHGNEDLRELILDRE
uniref:ribosomal protein S19 n=1 Tax=Achillea wilsoniana TaxID=282772 RepID=UPI00286D26B1|nr:ribosomal protein S19 [Achillea wilsoniana]WLW15396.1 ribosomal protein S19 [Achillea wilsoniana]